MNSTCTQQSFQTEHYSSIASVTVQWIVFQKSKGTNHYSWTVTVTVHQTVPRQNHSDHYLLSVEKEFTFSKSNSPSVIPAISCRIQRLPPVYKRNPSISFFNRSSLAETTPPFIVRSNLEPSPLQPLIM